MSVPRFVKIALTLGLAYILAPLAEVPAGLSIFSGAGVLSAVQEVLIGIAIGMVVRLAFEALALAGQSIATTMGLGFATLVDPEHGANTPVLGQLFMIFGMLTYLALNGHLVLLGALAKSFKTLPIGGASIDRNFLLAVAGWGTRVFETGLLVALPAVIALIIVNLALGVITRAAPQLNLFGIGFTITLMAGFFVLIVGLDGLMVGVSSLIDGALAAAQGLIDVPAAGGR
jgi:flagellar biosynthetic protein FliR